MSKKDDFLKVLNNSRKSLSTGEKIAKQFIRDIQLARDFGECAEDFVNGLPNEDALDPQQWKHLTGAWQGIAQTSQSIENMGTGVGSFTAAVSGTGLTMTSVFQVYTVTPMNDRPSVFLQKPIDDLYRLLDKDDLVAEVKTLLKRFGLDDRAGFNKSPLELFEVATASLEIQVAANSALAMALALRECIDQAIDRLLKRRLTQEEARGRPRKINSIGSQCGKVGLAPDHFAGLGIDADSIHKALSGTKEVAQTREETIRLFERGALLIKTFLTSIDETKLKPKRTV